MDTIVDVSDTDTAEAISPEAPEAPAKGAAYPFLSKAQIKVRLSADDEFVLTCLAVMQGRQTEAEQELRATIVKNRAGWMSSHAVNGGKLAAKAASEGLSSEELEKARGMVSRYSKQLASHFRQA